MAWTMVVTPCCDIVMLGGAEGRALTWAPKPVNRLHCRAPRGEGPPQPGHMPAFYGLPPEPQEETMHARRTAERATASRPPGRPRPDGCGLLGLFDGGDPGRPVVHRRQPECVEPAPGDPEVDAGRQGPQVGQGAAHAAGACLGRPAVRLPQPQEGAQLRGAGASGAARRTACPRRCAGPKARACHRRRFPAPPCSPPRSARSSPPRCGRAAARREASRAAALLRARPRPAGARSAPTPADDRSRRRDPCRQPPRRAPARRRCDRAPPAAGPAARPASSASGCSRARARSRPAACGTRSTRARC